MDLKPQDLLVLLKVAAHPPQRWTYAALGEALGLSASEAHASVKRAVACGLAVAGGRGEWSPVRPSLLEFCTHGVRYVWPAVPGPVKRGVPTAFGAEPLASQLAVAAGEAPVWAHPAGSAKGPTLSPLYRTAPQAALADPALHRVLALVDALRAGRARERTLAARLLDTELKQGQAPDPGAADARR
ncbi:MAG: MarR family transcriptional regulator [Aquabacterium sp.]